jgi:hypothetical protein
VDENENGRYDGEDPAAEGVTVQLVLDDEVVQTAVSDEDGRYEFGSVEEGTYEIEVEENGVSAVGSTAVSNVKVTSEEDVEVEKPLLVRP